MSVKPLPVPRACLSCGAAMPADAQRCTNCKSFQDWRRHIPGSEVVLALLLSLISVLGALAPVALRALNYRSQTYVRLLGTDEITQDNEVEPVLLVLVGNNGGRPALVRGARLAFENVPIAATNLNILNTEAKLILPEKMATLQLTIDHLDQIGDAKKEAVMNAVANGTAIITVDVEQTMRFGNRPMKHQQDRASANLIWKWMDSHVQ